MRVMLADWINESAEPVITDVYKELIAHRPSRIWDFINQLSAGRLEAEILLDSPPSQCSACLEQCLLTHELRRAYMATVYDTLQLAEIERQQPDQLSLAVLAAKRRAMSRSRHVLTLGLPAAQVRPRAASSSSDDDDDEADEDLPDILEMAPLTWRSRARPSIRAEMPTKPSVLGHWEKSEEDMKLIREKLACLFLFEALEDEASLGKLVDCLKPVEYGGGSEIFREGDPGDGIFLIKNGEVLLRRGAKVLKTLGRGDVFGELGVLHCLDPRTHSALATTPAELLFLDRASYSTLIREGRREQS